MTPIFLDIETAPIDDVESYLPDFGPRKGTKDEAKQAAQIADKRDAALRDASLDPDLSRIVCLGFGGLDDDRILVCQDEGVEAEALCQFWDRIREASSRSISGDWLLIGYNLLSFDLVRIYRRSLYLDVPPYQIQRDKYKHPRVVDLWDLLSEQGRLSWRGIDYYIRRFGLEDRIPSDPCKGEDVPRLAQEGAWDVIRGHNACDLAKNRALALRLGVVTPAMVDAA